MKVFAFALALIFLLLLFQGTAHAQPKTKWVLAQVLNAENNLPQSSVTSLYFDNQTGLLWIGTEGGLVQYNGATSKFFDMRNTPNLKIARINGIYFTAKNELIVLDKVATGLRIQGDSVANAQHADYSKFYFSEAGSLGYGTFLKLPSIGEPDKIKAGDIIESKIKDHIKFASFVNDSVTYAFSSNAGFFINKNGNQFKFDNEVDIFDYRFHFHNGEDLVILNRKLNGFYFNAHDKKSFPLYPADPELISDKSLFFMDRAVGRCYVVNGNTIFQIGIDGNKTVLHQIAILPDVPADISFITTDGDGKQIFVGTTNKGLYVYEKSIFYTYEFNSLPQKESAIHTATAPSRISNVYSSVILDSNHIHIFYQEEKPKAAILNLQDGSFDASPADSCFAFQSATDGKQHLYAQGGELTQFSFDNGKLVAKPVGFGFPPYAIFYDEKYDRIWAVDRNRNMFGYIERGSFKRVIQGPETYVLSTIKRVNDILYACSDTTVYRIDEKNNRLETIISFKDRSVRDIYPDKDQLIWIATYGKGIYLYDEKTKKLYHPKIDNRGYLSFSHCFIDDGHGNFFIPTNNGLFRMNRQSLIDACTDSTRPLRYQYYDVSKGLAGNEFNGGCMPAFNRLSNGDFLLPSAHGLVRIFTSEIHSPEKYPLFIQRVTTPVANYGYTSAMLFGKKERTITWELNFSQWQNPGSYILSYQLDDDSIQHYLEPGEKKVQLTDLAGGNHKLTIHTQFDLDGQQVSSFAIAFSIERKFYELIWFWILVAACLIIIIYIAAMLRNRQLRISNIELERKINSKTAEVRSKNADLQDTLESLNTALEHLEQNSRFQQKLMALMAHDIMIPLQYVGKVTKQLENYGSKLSAETTAGAIHEIGNTATQLLYLGESVIHWIKFQEGEFIPHYSEFDLNLLVEELVSLHKGLVAEKNNILKNEVPEATFCNQEPVIIKIILNNLLLNANKFTSNGTITLSALFNKMRLQLIVSDTGVGIEQQLVNDLNNEIVAFSEKGTDNETGWGLGYKFIIELVKFVHGKFSIESVRGKETKIIIDLPSDLNMIDATSKP